MKEGIENRYQTFIENAVEGIYQTTPEGRYLIANMALARIYGYESPEAFLEAVQDIAVQIYADARRRDQLREKLKRDGLLKDEESPARKRDGSMIWISETMREVRDGAGVLLYYEGSVTDITTRKATEAARLQEMSARQEAERRYRAFIENAVEGIYQTSPEGRYLMANKALARIYGYDSVDLFLDSVRDVANQIYVDSRRREALREKLKAENVLREEESQVWRRDGTMIWISESMREVRDADGTLRYYEGSVTDVTAKKEAEVALQQEVKAREEAERRYRAVIENSVDGIYQTSPQGHYLMANKALAQIYGYPAVGLFLESVRDVANQVYVDPGRRAQLREKLLAEGVLREEESEVWREDGSKIWISESMREVRDADGTLRYYEGSVTDITAKKKAEAALRRKIKATEESESRFRTVVENAVEGIYQTSPEGHYLMANKALAQIYGYDSVDLFLEAVRDVANQVYVDPRRREKLRQMLRSEGVLKDEESQVRRKDGAVIWISESMREVRHPDGALRYYEGSVVNVTPRKEADAARQQEIKTVLGSYISPAVMDQLLTTPGAIKLGGVKRPVTILFSDIRSFSSFSETMKEQEEELVRQLNEYFERMVGCVLRHDGTLHKYIGDAIMAAWGDVVPRKPADDAKSAVRAALAMRRELAELNRARAAAGLFEFRIGIGLNHGPVIVGNIGAIQKREFTVIGDAVNLAFRMEGVTKHFHADMAVGESVRALLGDAFRLRTLGLIVAKGQTKPIRVYEVLEEVGRGENNLVDAAWAEAYEEGFNLYLDRRFAEAVRKFEEALETRPDDFCTNDYLRQSRAFALGAPSKDWSPARTV